MILFELFLTFLMIGFISFGGGYAMIPVIQIEVVKKGWLTTQEFTDIIAISGMSPGPIATNSAIYVGLEVAGFLGAIISALGMVIPSFILILLISTVFNKVSHHPLTKSAFYGLRPIITGLILYAAINFSISNNILTSFSLHSLSLLIILLLSLVALLRFNIHPLFVIIISGIIGAIIYS